MSTDDLDYMKLVGTRIRTLRKQAQLSQDELSGQCGIYRTYLSRIEAGLANPTLQVLFALANSLDTSTSDLVRISEAVPGHK